MLRRLIARYWSSKSKSRLRRMLRKMKHFFLHHDKTSIEELKHVLVEELGVKTGDRLIVTSGFASLNSNGYSPQDVILLLQDLVGEQGTLMLPYYPPMNSTEWAKKGMVFDMNTTKSGMGILTNVFKKMPGVVMSMHPTKAVCVWGKDAEYYAEGHENSTTPFYWDSPYGKFLKAGSKSLGLGIKNIPIFHVFEDVILDIEKNEYYQGKYRLKLIDKTKSEHVVETYVHNGRLMADCIPAGDYVKKLGCSSYVRFPFGDTFCYTIDNTELLEKCKVEFAKGHTREKRGK